jgi:hypothetical protein
LKWIQDYEDAFTELVLLGQTTWNNDDINKPCLVQNAQNIGMVDTIFESLVNDKSFSETCNFLRSHAIRHDQQAKEKNAVHYPMRRQLKSRFQVLRHKRLNEVITTNTYFSSTKSIEGFYCAQVFFGMISKTLYDAGMKSESECYLETLPYWKCLLGSQAVNFNCDCSSGIIGMLHFCLLPTVSSSSTAVLFNFSGCGCVLPTQVQLYLYFL